jgi:hypothetical protein
MSEKVTGISKEVPWKCSSCKKGGTLSLKAKSIHPLDILRLIFEQHTETAPHCRGELVGLEIVVDQTR